MDQVTHDVDGDALVITHVGNVMPLEQGWDRWPRRDWDTDLR
jgi:hypothetical protein